MGINNAITCLRASLRDLGAKGFSLLSAGESSLSKEEEEMGLQLCWVSRRNAGLDTDLQSLSYGLTPCPASVKDRKKCVLIPSRFPMARGTCRQSSVSRWTMQK